MENLFKACTKCGRDLPLSQDHFIPLSKGGEYTLNNIIPACVHCNSSKHIQSFFEWYPKYKYYSSNREKKILIFLGFKNGNQQLKIIWERKEYAKNEDKTAIVWQRRRFTESYR